MKQPQLFTPEQAPRAPNRKLMHVEDAGQGMIMLECKHCGHNTGWIEETETVATYRRGIPCPKCNDATEENDMRISNSYLIDGDAMKPAGTDLIAQVGRLDVGQPVPDGWRVITGNNDSSLVARVVMRFEIEEDVSAALERLEKVERILRAGPIPTAESARQLADEIRAAILED